MLIGCAGDNPCDGEQVGPQERKPEFLLVLRARQGDESVLGEFHQGPQTEIQSAIRPDIRL